MSDTLTTNLRDFGKFADANGGQYCGNAEESRARLDLQLRHSMPSRRSKHGIGRPVRLSGVHRRRRRTGVFSELDADSSFSTSSASCPIAMVALRNPAQIASWST